MNHVISIICWALLGLILLFEYFKDKKPYRLLAAVLVLFPIFFQTPLSNHIGELASNTVVGILILLAVFIFYLVFQDEKRKAE